MKYYIVKWQGHEKAVYDTQDLIKLHCDLVNGCGVSLDDITIITVENGKQTITSK